MASNLRGVHMLLLAALLALKLLPACLAQEQHRQFYRWSAPDEFADKEDGLFRRQGPLPGYHPEFGTCGSGTTCETACGQNWLSCKASTTLSLFCYNKVQLNQTCCENGSGRACDNGYYCAWNTFGGKVWCCKNGQSLEECKGPEPSSSTVPHSSSTEPPPHSSTIPPPESSTYPPQSSTTCHPTKTITETVTVSAPCSATTCPPVSVVTVHDTTTKTETVTVYGSVSPGITIVTVVSTVTSISTVTTGCSTTPTPTPTPPHTKPWGDHGGGPPDHGGDGWGTSTTSCPPSGPALRAAAGGNSTATIATVSTAGAGTWKVRGPAVAMVALLVGMVML